MSIQAAVATAGAPVIPNFGDTSSCVRNNDTFCWPWFKAHWSTTFEPALIDHIRLTVIAIAIGFAISFVLALAAHRYGWLTTPITLLASLLYTIPSLAAFAILVSITGINDYTVELPLISYSLLILFTNTLAGLTGVSPEVVDAARGSGLTPRQILTRVELPLALPTIIAGLRVAVVTIISLTTIAAYIVPEGLGKPIFDALGSGDFNTKFIASGVLCVALALVADALIAIIQRVLTPWASSRRVA